MAQKPLPPRHQNQPDTIVLDRPKLAPPPVADAEKLAPEIEFERDPANRAIVDATARLKHPLLRAAAEALRACKPDYSGFVYSGRGCVDICVTPGSPKCESFEDSGAQFRREGKTLAKTRSERVDGTSDEVAEVLGNWRRERDSNPR